MLKKTEDYRNEKQKQESLNYRSQNIREGRLGTGEIKDLWISATQSGWKDRTAFIYYLLQKVPEFYIDNEARNTHHLTLESLATGHMKGDRFKRIAVDSEGSVDHYEKLIKTHTSIVKKWLNLFRTTNNKLLIDWFAYIHHQQGDNRYQDDDLNSYNDFDYYQNLKDEDYYSFMARLFSLLIELRHPLTWFAQELEHIKLNLYISEAGPLLIIDGNSLPLGLNQLESLAKDLDSGVFQYSEFCLHFLAKIFEYPYFGYGSEEVIKDIIGDNWMTLQGDKLVNWQESDVQEVQNYLIKEKIRNLYFQTYHQLQGILNQQSEQLIAQAQNYWLSQLHIEIERNQKKEDTVIIDAPMQEFDFNLIDSALDFDSFKLQEDTRCLSPILGGNLIAEIEQVLNNYLDEIKQYIKRVKINCTIKTINSKEEITFQHNVQIRA